MSDFSFFSLFTAGLACFAPLAAAYTQPVGDAPEGNPISQPGLNSVVPAGDNFTITWEPTTQGTVTLVLLKGPSTNAVPQYAIVEKTPNDGTYVWNVASDLQPTDNAQGYGIQLIDDATGQYQYTTQFGISNPDYKASSSSSSSAETTPSATGYGHSTTTEAPKTTTWTTYCPFETTFTHGGKTYSVTKATTLTITDCSTTAHVSKSSSWAPIGTGASSGIISKPANVTMVAPTGYAPTTIATTAAYNAPSTPSSAPAPSVTPFKGTASTVATSFFGLAAAAALALMAM